MKVKWEERTNEEYSVGQTNKQKHFCFFSSTRENRIIIFSRSFGNKEKH